MTNYSDPTDRYGREFPVLTGEGICQGHADFCREFGHAVLHYGDGKTMDVCPRCAEPLEKAEAPAEEPTEELTEAPAEEPEEQQTATVTVKVPARLVDVLNDRDVFAYGEFKGIEADVKGNRAKLTGTWDALAKLGDYVWELADWNRQGVIRADEMFGLGATRLEDLAQRFPR